MKIESPVREFTITLTEEEATALVVFLGQLTDNEIGRTVRQSPYAHMTDHVRVVRVTDDIYFGLGKHIKMQEEA